MTAGEKFADACQALRLAAGRYVRSPACKGLPDRATAWEALVQAAYDLVQAKADFEDYVENLPPPGGNHKRTD